MSKCWAEMATVFRPRLSGKMPVGREIPTTTHSIMKPNCIDLPGSPVTVDERLTPLARGCPMRWASTTSTATSGNGAGTGSESTRPVYRSTQSARPGASAACCAGIAGGMGRSVDCRPSFRLSWPPDDPNGARITDAIGFHGLVARNATLMFYTWIYYLSPLDSFLGFCPWDRQKVVRLPSALDGTRFAPVRSISDPFLADEAQ